MQLRAQEMGVDMAKIQADLAINQQTNEKDLLEENIRAGVSLTTAQIDAKVAEDKNDTDIILENMKQSVQ